MGLRPDQEGVLREVLSLLRSKTMVGLQAPTGWGKTVLASALAREFDGVIYTAPLIAIMTKFLALIKDSGKHAVLTLGREAMCNKSLTPLDLYIKGACTRCELNNKPTKAWTSLPRIVGPDLIKSTAANTCWYNEQERIVSNAVKNGEYVIIAHHSRLNKLLRRSRPDLVIIDEAHWLALPRIKASIPLRAIELLLNKLGIEAPHDAELLRMVITENLEALINIHGAADDDLAWVIEQMLMGIGDVWIIDEEERALMIYEKPRLLERLGGVKTLLMSATLPPSTIRAIPTVRVRRGWNIRARVVRVRISDAEGVRRALRNEVMNGTVVFTTISREELVSTDAVFEDEVRYEDLARTAERGVLVLHMFGKYAEGIDLPNIRKLILLGIPALPPGAAAKMGIDRDEVAVLKTVQLIGRAVRTTEQGDTPEVVLMDRRFMKYRDALLREYEIELVG